MRCPMRHSCDREFNYTASSDRGLKGPVTRVLHYKPTYEEQMTFNESEAMTLTKEKNNTYKQRTSPDEERCPFKG